MYRLLLLCFCCLCVETYAQKIPSISHFHDGIHHWNIGHKVRNYPRYSESEYEKIADNLIAYQNQDGGWMKNMDWLGIMNIDSVKNTLNKRYRSSTLDNRNVYTQIEYLAEVYTLTGKKKYSESAMRGLTYILKLQKPNGGWRGWDVDAITFNDDVMTGVMELLQKIVQGDSDFVWLKGKKLHKQIEEAYRKGMDLILKCQIVQNGVKTAWAQQHDNVTFAPVKARSFELPGITANESSEIILLLMMVKEPTPEIINAVECAVAWLNKVALHGFRVQRIPLPDSAIINHEYPYDNVVVEDVMAPAIWARYYEVDNNVPFMCTRPGQKVWKLSDVDPERRTGYAWYGYWPEQILDLYEGWHARVTAKLQN